MNIAIPPRDARILIIDDERGIRDLLSLELSSLGYTVETAPDGVAALEAITLQDFQLVLCDIKMPHIGGLEVLQVIREKHPDTEVIMMTGYGTVETAVAAMKQGAYDFIQKPFDLSEILALIEKCLEKSQLRAVAALYEASQSIFRSVKIDELLPLITEVALKIFQADTISIMLINEGGALVPACTAGVLTEALTRVHLKLGMRANPVEGFQHEPEIIRDLSGLDGLTSVMVCPFSMDHEPLGVLIISRSRRTDPFLISDRLHAAIFTSQTAQAVFNAILYRRLNFNIQELQKANKKLADAQQQLIQSEKLAGIGQLAAGVAHELNNPLSGVLGFTELLMADNQVMTDQQKEDLNTIYTQGKRCQVIIQNLLQFSRPNGSEKLALDVIPLLYSVMNLSRHNFSGSHINIELSLPESLPAIYANAGQLQQVFLNLMTNARHAMAGGKNAVLTLTAGVLEDHIFIRFADNGSGMTKEIQSHIFEPFFTTKPVGQGTGLGLSICYGIVQQHQGKLNVESEVDRGTTFTLELPIYKEKNNVIEKKGVAYGKSAI